MYKAVFLTYDLMQGAPTAKEIKTYLGKSAKLLYGNDQRKSKNTPYPDKLHLIESAFFHFRDLFKTENNFFHPELYIFDEKINEMHFFLKYTLQNLAHFKFDDKTIEDMNNVAWSHGHLIRYFKSIESDIGALEFFSQKNIGDPKFHKAFPSFVKKFDTIKSHTTKEIDKLEKKAYSLFRSGW